MASRPIGIRACGKVLATTKGGRAMTCPQPAYPGVDGCWWHAIGQPHSERIAARLRKGRTT